MKNIILKIFIVVSCICIIICSCCSVFATDVTDEIGAMWQDDYNFDVNTYNHVLSPTTCFTYTRSNYNGLVTNYYDGTPNFVQDGVTFFYSSQDGQARPIDRISIMTNLGTGFTFRKGVSYKIRFKLVIPSSYAPGGSVGSMWHSSNYKIGFYSWASPQFDANPNICYLSCVQLDNQPSNNLIDYSLNLNKFYVPINYINYDLVYFNMVANFVPSSDVTAKAFGMTFNGYFSSWYGQIGLGDFYITMGSQYAPIETPNIDKKPSQDLDDLEQELLDEIDFQGDLDNIYSVFDIYDTDSLDAVNYIFTKSFESHNLLYKIFQISLALGITGFVLSTAHLIVSKSSNKPSKIKRGKGG